MTDKSAKINKTIFNFALSFFTLIFVFYIFPVNTANAATLFIRPSQATVTVGNIVNVQVTVDTTGKVINNAESIVEYPKEFLEVVSVDKVASIFSLWPEEPAFNNILGQASFNGGVPNPGFIGSSGKIVSITFRAKKVGTASLILSDSAVRANDGFGTDVLSGKVGAQINIVGIQPVVPPPTPTPTPTVTDFNFVISSATHPNQSLWYNKNDVAMSWTLPKSATAVKTSINTYKDSEPVVYYDKPITTKSIENVDDGIWYFHANYLSNGVWAKAKHYKLQIDTTDPTNLSVSSEKDPSGKVTLSMKAEDALSGIDHYLVTVDSDSPIKVKADAEGGASLEVPFYKSGEHNLTIVAYDRAGNKTETKISISTDFLLGLIIDSYPAKVMVNESIEITGTAPYPYASLRVSMKDDNSVVQTYKTKSNSYSKFNFISQPVPTEGKYTLWVDMLRDNEEVILSSQRVTVIVETPLLLQIGSYTIGLMKVLIPAISLFWLFLIISLYGWYKFFKLYRKVRKESREAEKVLGRSFYLLRKDLREHIAKLKRAQSRRKLSAEEYEFLEQFEAELSEAEDVIEKEVKDIVDL